MRFQLSQRYTKEDFAAYYRAATKNSTRQADRFRHLFQCYLLISAAVLAGLAIFEFFSSFQIPPLIFSVPAAFLLAIILLQSAGILLRSVLHSTDQKRPHNYGTATPLKAGKCPSFSRILNLFCISPTMKAITNMLQSA